MEWGLGWEEGMGVGIGMGVGVGTGVVTGKEVVSGGWGSGWVRYRVWVGLENHYQKG